MIIFVELDYYRKMPNWLPNFWLIFTKSCLIANLGIIEEKWDLRRFGPLPSRERLHGAFKTF